jgi:hypothetical protein
MFSITENGNTIFLINISHHEPGLCYRFFEIFVALYETGLWPFASTFLIFKSSLKTIVATILIIVTKVLSSP